MATYPQPSGPSNSYCVGEQVVHVGFLANGASNPATVYGPFVTTVVHTATGLYTMTLVGLAPKALVGASVYASDNANADDTTASIGAVVITNSTKTITVRVATRTGAGTLKDIAANAASSVKVVLRFKVYPGRDNTGL